MKKTLYIYDGNTLECREIGEYISIYDPGYYIGIFLFASNNEY